MSHPQFSIDIIILSFAGFFGQIFQYKILKAFQQHMVPFIMSTRKMITVGLSIIYFGHDTSLGQVLGLAIVFIAAIYEFIKSVLKSELQTKR
jgi:UDP-galactose transporter B1